MKLKKIASLALAGVMAVSMLAGCAGKEGNTPNTDDPTTTASSVVKALNDGQDADNDVKISFTDNASLDSALKRAVEKYGVNVNATQLETAAKDLAGVVAEKASNTAYGSFVTDGLLNGTTNYYYSGNGIKNAKDKTFTVVNVKAYTGFASEENAMKAMAADVDAAIAKLPARSTLTKSTTETTGVAGTGADKLVTGDKYFTFSYAGEASVVGVEQNSGTTTYYLVYTISQTVAEKTL